MPRLRYLDLAKGFTVLCMPTVHAVMLYGDAGTHTSIIGAWLQLIAEWPGAQVFMFAMGTGVTFSKRSTAFLLKRAITILLCGYLMNALKFLPLFRFLPNTFLQDLEFSHTTSVSARHLLLLGDILHFAGLALLLLALVKKCGRPALVAVFLAYFVMLFAPLFWDHHHANPVADHLLHLLGGRTGDAFFPVFPWLTYPLFGFATGCYLQQPLASMRVLFATGCLLFFSGWILHETLPVFPVTPFYRTYADATIMHFGFVLLWVSLWYWIDRRFNTNISTAEGPSWFSIAVLFLQYCGKHITAIYVVQWLVVFWVLPAVGYQRLSIIPTLAIVIAVNVMVFSAVLFFVRARKSRDG